MNSMKAWRNCESRRADDAAGKSVCRSWRPGRRFPACVAAGATLRAGRLQRQQFVPGHHHLRRRRLYGSLKQQGRVQGQADLRQRRLRLHLFGRERVHQQRHVSLGRVHRRLLGPGFVRQFVRWYGDLPDGVCGGGGDVLEDDGGVQYLSVNGFCRARVGCGDNAGFGVSPVERCRKAGPGRCWGAGRWRGRRTGRRRCFR